MSVPQENNSVPVQETPANDKEKNLVAQRKMYERQLEQERFAKAELEKRLADLESAKKSHPRDLDVDDDDDSEPYVDKRTLKKQLSRFAENMGKDIDRRAEEKARAMLDQERQINFMKQNADFGSVLTEENVAKFAEKHPEIAEQMLEMPDNFARQKLLYQNIKALRVHLKEEQKATIQDTINKNMRNNYYQPTQSGSSPPYAMQGDFSKVGQKNAYEKMKGLIDGRKG